MNTAGNVRMAMESIGFVRGGRVEATKDGWGSNRSTVELRGDLFEPSCLQGLDANSHVEILFYFHLGADEPTEYGARRPRGRADWPAVGIFAPHGRMRPNRIGVSICRLLSVTGLTLFVEGLDAVDGSPVLDIKPVWNGYLPRGALREPRWAQELMAGYW
jgi:tRNA (adenine37-N6)-methyltransferase